MPDKNAGGFIDFLLRHEERWCEAMNFFNPYLDPFQHHLRGDVPVYDGACYDRYPKHRYVYDKLWVARSQDIPSGLVSDLLASKEAPEYPIFVKPRWGHKTSGSKHCQKIKRASDLPDERAARANELMWSELLPGSEGMTDFVLVKGSIVYQMSHTCSEQQHGFADAWKYTSPLNKPPDTVHAWVSKHLQGFTGIVNTQYRDGKIFEVGLRPARTGAYFAATDNEALLRNISTALGKEQWNPLEIVKMNYKPFYSFKVHTDAPVLYLWPQYVLDILMRSLTDRPFYEYYPEPTGREGMVFLQFMDDDLERGKRTSLLLQRLFTYTQWFVIGMMGALVIALALDWKYKWWLASGVMFLYASQLLNPISVPIRFARARTAQAKT